MTQTWAVIPTKDRADGDYVIGPCLISLIGQVDGAVIVDNNDVALNWQLIKGLDFPLLPVHKPGYPPNLSALYNAGLDAVEQAVAEDREEGSPDLPAWNVVLLNDDVEVSPGWVKSLTGPLREAYGGDAVAAYTDRISRTEMVLQTEPSPSQFYAMTCWACVLRGETGIRWDEDFRWWYGDNDLDIRCRQLGGVIAVPGLMPDHKHPSQQTFADPVLSAQAHVDEQTFNRKWAGKL